jgi:hypothetical protein
MTLEEAERLLMVAIEKDQEANTALEAAKAAYAQLDKPMPLFDRLKKSST